jgi:hypothetical protein
MIVRNGDAHYQDDRKLPTILQPRFPMNTGDWASITSIPAASSRDLRGDGLGRVGRDREPRAIDLANLPGSFGVG